MNVLILTMLEETAFKTLEGQSESKKSVMLLLCDPNSEITSLNGTWVLFESTLLFPIFRLLFFPIGNNSIERSELLFISIIKYILLEKNDVPSENYKYFEFF